MKTLEPKSLLLTTDFTECAEAAIPYAVALAKRHAAELILLHVGTRLDGVFMPNVLDVDFDLYMNAVEHDSRTRLESVPLGSVEGVPVRREFVWDHSAAAGIVKFAREEEIGWVVMSSHGRRHLANVLLGGVARNVSAAGPCPVLCVKPGARGCLDPESGELLIRRILVPTDMSESSSAALDRGCRLAELYRAEVHILHIVNVEILTEYPPELVDALQLLARRPHDRIRDRMRELEQQVEKYAVPTVVEVSQGSPAREIARYANDHDIDVVVMSRKGRGRTPHLLGAVPERLLHDTQHPVLVV